jgi:iron complex outermembrane receptor protein
VPPFVNWPTNYSDPWQVDPVHPADVQRIHFRTYYVQGDFDLGFGLLTVLPAFTQSQRAVMTNLIVGTAIPGAIAASTWSERQKTLEVRLASPESSRIVWVLGLYGFKTANIESGTAAQITAASYETNDVQVPATSYAAFGQLTYPLTDALRLTGGLRYTKDKKTYEYDVQSLIGSFDSGLIRTSASYSAVTYKAGLEYDLTPTSMLYGSVASGYKAGGFSTTAIPPVAYDPEHLTAVELGSKNRFIDDRLQLNASIYHYAYRNYQVQYPLYSAASPNGDDPPGTTVFAQYVVNSKTGTNQGVEFEGRYFVTPHTTIRAAYTYIDAHYGDMKTPALSYISRTSVINTPKMTELLGFDQDFPFYKGRLTLSAQIRWYGGYRIALDKGLPGGDLHLYQDGYHKSDAHLSYEPENNHWNLTLWARNLENDAQLTQALPFGRVQITDPRTFGLNLNTRF